MAQYTTGAEVDARVAAGIKNQTYSKSEIDGRVGFSDLGVATISTTPPALTTGAFYQIYTAGTYSNLSGIVVTTGDIASGLVRAVYTPETDSWTKEIIPVNLDGYAEKVTLDGKVIYAPLVSTEYSSITGTDGGADSGFYDRNDGTLTTSVGRRYALFEISDASLEYVISCNLTGGSVIALAVYFDAAMTYLGFEFPVDSGDTNFVRQALNIPTGTKYIGSGTQNTRPFPVLELVTNVYQQYAPTETTYSKTEVDTALEEKASNVTDDGEIVRAPEKITYTLVMGESFGVSSGFYQYIDGVVAASSTRKRIRFAVDDSKNYVITGRIDGASQVAVAVFFDESMNYLGYQERVTSGFVEYNRFELSLPVGTAFVGTGNWNISGELILEEVTSSGYKQVLFEGDIPSNNLIGKRILVLGDSIMAGVGFAEVLASRNSMILNNISVGGATVAVKVSNTNDIVSQVGIAISGSILADYIIFDGLTNDISNSSTIVLGDISSGYTATLDTSTFSGAFEYICKNLRLNWLPSKIAYIRVHKMSSRNQTSQVDFGQRALEICEKWSIPVIDIFKEGGLNSNITEMRDAYTTSSDATHPNPEGYLAFYIPKVEALLRTL